MKITRFKNHYLGTKPIIFKMGKFGIPITELTLPQCCACPKPMTLISIIIMWCSFF
jgi:hypothetical protein